MKRDERVPPAIYKYFDSINKDDWEGLAEAWHEDGQMRATGARPRDGRDEVVGYFPRIFSFWEEHLDEPTRIMVDGNTIVAEVHFTGRTPDGREVEFDAVDVFDVEDGRIKRLSNWYDVAYARSQLEPPGEGDG